MIVCSAMGKTTNSLISAGDFALTGQVGDTVICCTLLHCTVLHCIVLHCNVLYCTVLHSTALHCTVLFLSPLLNLLFLNVSTYLKMDCIFFLVTESFPALYYITTPLNFSPYISKQYD